MRSPIRRVLCGLPVAVLFAASSASAQQSAALPQAPASATAPAPPRSVRDVLALLEKSKPSQAKVDADQATAEQVIPDSLSGAEKIDVFHKRGMAAYRLGRVKQAREDLTEAVRLAETESYAGKAGLYQDLSVAEQAGGNLRRAIELRTLALNTTQYAGQKVAFQASLALLLAGSGDLEGAEQSLAGAEGSLAELGRGGGRGPASGGGRGGGPQFLALYKGLIERARGNVASMRGKPGQADTAYAASIAVLDPLIDAGLKDPNGRPTPVRSIRDYAMSDRAMNMLRLDRPIEAEIMARQALASRLTEQGTYSAETAVTLQRLGMIIAEEGRTDDSMLIAKAVLEIMDKIGAGGASMTGAQAQATLARAFMVKGKWKEAQAGFAAVQARFADDKELWNRRFGADPDVALTAIKSGNVPEGRALAERAVARATQRLGPRHYGTAEALGIQAMGASAGGEPKAAMELFARSVPILLQRSRQSQDESTGRAMRDLRRQTILQAYIDTLMAISGTPLEQETKLNAAEEAFRVADIVRGQSVQAALAQSAARATIADPALAELARREQDAQKEIAGLNGILSNLLAAGEGDANPGAVQALRAQIDGLRDERGKLASEIEKRFPDYAELINPKPVGIAQIRAALKPGEALVAFYVSDQKSYVWAIPQAGDIAVAVVPMGAEKLAERVALLRAALDPNAGTVEEIPAFDVAAAYELYSAFLAPVEKGWQSAKNLIVVADGALSFLPLAILPTKPVGALKDSAVVFSSYRSVPWLARTHAVTMVPSVAALKALRAAPAREAKAPFVGFGDPYFNAEQAAQGVKDGDTQLAMRGGKVALLRRNASVAESDSTTLANLPRLADTRSELLNIARALKADPQKDVFLGKEANTERVKTMPLKDYRVLAFATHGLVPGELNGLAEPALAMSAPDVAGVPGDGLLKLDDILGLKLDADWVVLSACNTASGDGAGAEAVSGLGRAFFYAGTRAILATGWPVHSASAARLTAELFRRQAGDAQLGRAEALRQAEIAIIDGKGYEDQGSGKEVFAYAHPLFWAPYSLYGDGG